MIYKISDQEYFALDRLSSSGIKALDVSIAQFNTKTVPTSAKIFGSAFHCLVLEYEDFNDRYFVTTHGRRTNLFKEQQKENPNKESITAVEYSIMKAMKNSLLEHPYLVNTLSAIGKPYILIENTILSDYAGIQGKCKPDLIDTIENIIIDLKTTDDIAKVERDIANYKYFIQSTWYKELYSNESKTMPRFIFAFVEKKAPYNIKIIELNESWDEVAYPIINNACALYNSRHDFFYIGIDPNVIILDCPAYLRSKHG